MQDRNVNKQCVDPKCDYAMKAHWHVRTNDGVYVKFIVEKPKQKVQNEENY